VKRVAGVSAEDNART